MPTDKNKRGGLTKLTTGEITGAITIHEASELTPAENLGFYQAAAETILNAYPNAGVHDIETYLRVVRETLVHFGRETTLLIADPMTGIISQCAFPPTVADIHRFVNPDPVPENKRTYAPIAFPPERKFTKPTAEEREAGYAKAQEAIEELKVGDREERRDDPRAHCTSHHSIRKQYGMPLDIRK